MLYNKSKQKSKIKRVKKHPQWAIGYDISACGCAGQKYKSTLSSHMTLSHDAVIWSHHFHVTLHIHWLALRMLTLAISTSVLALSLSFLWSIFTFRKLEDKTVIFSKTNRMGHLLNGDDFVVLFSMQLHMLIIYLILNPMVYPHNNTEQLKHCLYVNTLKYPILI